MRIKSNKNNISIKNVVVFITGDSLGGAEKIITRQFANSRIKEKLELTIIRRTAKDSLSLIDYTNHPLVKLRTVLFGSSNIIHSHLFLAGLFIRIKKIFNKNFYWIHTIHYSDYEGMRFGRIKYWLDKNFIFSSPDRLVAVSTIVFKKIKHLKNSHLINNGLNLQNKYNNNKPTSENLVLGCIGMLRSEKGLEDLILSIQQVKNEYSSIKLKIAGTGPLKDKLIELIKKNNLSDNVELCGYIKDIDSFLNSLSIYVQPSKSESFGLSVLQAFEHGLPVVTSDAGNLKNLLRNGEFGYLIPRDNHFVDQLAQSIVKVSKDMNSYSNMSLKALEHWKPLLSEDKMISEYDDLYTKASTFKKI